MPQKRSSRQTAPRNSAAGQRWTDICRSHPLPVQWNSVRNLASELREDIPKKVHSVGFLLRRSSQHEAHFRLHGASLLLFPAAALLFRIFEDIHWKHGKARKRRSSSHRSFIWTIHESPATSLVEAFSIQTRTDSRLLGAELLGFVQFRRQNFVDRQESAASQVKHWRPRSRV